MKEPFALDLVLPQDQTICSTLVAIALKVNVHPCPISSARLMAAIVIPKIKWINRIRSLAYVYHQASIVLVAVSRTNSMGGPLRLPIVVSVVKEQPQRCHSLVWREDKALVLILLLAVVDQVEARESDELNESSQFIDQ